MLRIWRRPASLGSEISTCTSRRPGRIKRACRHVSAAERKGGGCGKEGGEGPRTGTQERLVDHVLAVGHADDQDVVELVHTVHLQTGQSQEMHG